MEMNSDEFKEGYLVPLDNATKVSSIKRRPLLDEDLPTWRCYK